MYRGSDAQRSSLVSGVKSTAPALALHAENSQTDQRLLKLSQAFLRLGVNVDRNIQILCETASKLLSAHCAIYTRLLDGKTFTSGDWQCPRGIGGGTLLDGTINHQVLTAGEIDDQPLILRKLHNTRFIENDPNVAGYGLQTYVGQAVKRAADPCGILAVVFAEDVEFDVMEKQILRVLAGAIGVEEHRGQGQLLESERRQVLEMVALNEPLEHIMDRLLEMSVRAHPEVAITALLLRDGHLTHAAALNMPEELLEAIDQHATQLAGMLQLASTRLVEMEEQAVISNIVYDPAWLPLRDVTLRHGLRACCSMRILLPGGDAAGMLMAFCRAQDRLTPADMDLLKTLSRLAAMAIDQRQAVEQMAHGAQHDPLTGLPNRLLFEERLQSALKHARQFDQSVGLLFIDLDRFKIINDTLGHHCGDELLHEVSLRFKACVRRSDTLVRLGGDEFGVVLPELKDRSGAVRVAKAMLASLRTPLVIGGHEFHITASIGISVFPQDATESADLQRHADTAMYRAKNSGKNAFQCFAPEMNAMAMERLSLENDLRRAVDNGELRLHFQPLVDCDGRMYAAESLLRWNHPKRGLISPSIFIPLAEETGQILRIGKWVLQEACRQSQAWRDRSLLPVKIGVNVSASQFAQVDFVEEVLSGLESAGLSAAMLNLEITESMLMRSTEEVTRKLTDLRNAGVQLAIDDFGTGYSSLAYLQNLPVDTLKIDRSFVRQIPDTHGALTTDSRTAVIRAITSLAQALGMRVVAEGVETERQRSFLQMIGCDGLQGYYFSKPVPAEEFEKLIVAGGCVLPPVTTSVPKCAFP